MEKYWRIGRTDDEIVEFLDFLRTEHGYREIKQGRIFPSIISYPVGMTPQKTIIVNGHLFEGWKIK